MKNKNVKVLIIIIMNTIKILEIKKYQCQFLKNYFAK